LNKKKAVLFDLDGTLVNSAPTVLDIINMLRRNNDQMSLQLNPKIEQIISIGGRYMIVNLISKENVDKNLNSFRAMYEDYDLTNESLFDGVKELLAALSQKYTLSVLTNKPRTLANKTMTHHHIESFFDCLVCREDVLEKKPDPEGFNLILKTLNLIKDEVIYVGDSLIDFELAKSLKVDFFLYNRLNINQTRKDYKFYYQRFDSFEDLEKILDIL
jgi:HAD superfamily hydrolase (TIGR01549 family)